MKKSSEIFPLQFYVHSQSMSTFSSVGESDDDVTKKINGEMAIDVLSAYQKILETLEDVADRSLEINTARLFGNCFYESHKVDGHPNVYMRCEISKEKNIALFLERKIQESQFSGWAGVLIGAQASEMANLLKKHNAKPTFELGFKQGLPGLNLLQDPSLQSEVDKLIAELSTRRSKLSKVEEWFDKTEKVITVPENSLRETTMWISQATNEMQASRIDYQAKANAQEEAFMKLFTTLANSRQGA